MSARELSFGAFEPAITELRRVVNRIPPIPGQTRMHGPLTARRLRGLYALLAGVYLAGLAPVLLNASPAWKAFGLGLLFPGAGFLYAGGIGGVLLFVASAFLFACILFIWWARGVLPAPPAVLIGTAAGAAVWTGVEPGVVWAEWVIPAGVATLHGWLMVRRRREFVAAQARGVELNRAIATAEPVLRDVPTVVAPEMPPSQVKEFRRMLDLALQPVDCWNGFAMNDTWQDGALRYQISTMSWNLAFGQYTQLPAFHGYLNTAQENLIRKHIDRKTWNYWFWESLWGNLRVDRNPVHIDNIMLSGFLGVSLGLFETASGTSPFKGEGALTFRWDDTLAFPYSHSTLMQEIVKNYKRYDVGWFPCEPRWIYSMCNLVGRNALALHDARHGTRYVQEIADRFERTMHEEMMLPDGRIRVCTSSLFGFTVPALSGLFGEAWGIRFLTPHAPEQAERLWAVMKQDFIHRTPDGRLQFKLLPLGWDTRKPADFSRWPELNPLILTLWAALEMGDEEIVEATVNEIDTRYGEGVSASVTWARRNTIRDMVNRGLPKAWATGPILAQANYPETIVTRAVTDGQALSLVLQPGDQPGPVDLTLARLVPGGSYRIRQSDERFTASPDGSHRMRYNLAGRSQVDIVPVA